jgi:hypothetical protein
MATFITVAFCYADMLTCRLMGICSKYPSVEIAACKTRFSALLAIFQGAHWSENCMRLSIFCTFTIILQNYAGNKQKLYKIMKMRMSAI